MGKIAPKKYRKKPRDSYSISSKLIASLIRPPHQLSLNLSLDELLNSSITDNSNNSAQNSNWLVEEKKSGNNGDFAYLESIMFSSIINDVHSSTNLGDPPNSSNALHIQSDLDDSDPDGVVMESDLIFIGSPPPSPSSSNHNNNLDDHCFFDDLNERENRIQEAFEIRADYTVDSRSIVANYEDEEKVEQNFVKIVDEIEEELAKSSSPSECSSPLVEAHHRAEKLLSKNRPCSCKIKCECSCHDRSGETSNRCSSTNSCQSVGSFQNQRHCSPVNLEWDVSLLDLVDSSPKKYDLFADSSKSNHRKYI